MRLCAGCGGRIWRGRYIAMQIFSFHPLCALRFMDQTPQQEHDFCWAR